MNGHGSLALGLATLAVVIAFGGAFCATVVMIEWFETRKAARQRCLLEMQAGRGTPARRRLEYRAIGDVRKW